MIVTPVELRLTVIAAVSCAVNCTVKPSLLSKTASSIMEMLAHCRFTPGRNVNGTVVAA